MKKLLTILISIILLLNCSKTPTSPDNQNLNLKTSKVFIVNQGIWGGANGTLSIYDVDNDTLYNNVIELGNVANFITIYKNKAYVLNSTSNNIMVLDISEKQITIEKTISGFNNPWSATILNEKLYVANQTGDKVSVVDLNQLSVIKEIPVGTAPQGIYTIKDKVYVANTGYEGWGKPYLPGKISIIYKDNIIKEITAGINPQAFSSDSEENLYVVCAGDYGTIGGKIYKINTGNNTITDSLNINGAPNYIINDGNDKFIILGFMFNLNKVNFKQKTITSINDKMGTCLAADEQGNVYIGEPAPDFISPGKVYIYNSDFTIKKILDVGIGPSSIAFLKKNK